MHLRPLAFVLVCLMGIHYIAWSRMTHEPEARAKDGPSLALQACVPDGPSLALQACVPDGPSLAIQACVPDGPSLAIQACVPTLASPAEPQEIKPGHYDGMRWRMIGPFRGGRTVGAVG